MIKYTIAMSIRVACIFAMLFAQGWWLVVCAAGAIFLPYVAVVLANVSGPSRSDEVLRPGGLVRSAPPAPHPGPGAPGVPGPEQADADADSTDPTAMPPRDERGAA